MLEQCGAGTIYPNSVKYTKPDTRKVGIMDKYQCNVCGYIYDPEKGDPTQNIPPGTPFEQLPDDWTCPECGVGKEEFSKM